MSVIYNLTAINARLQGVVTTLDAGASNARIVILNGPTVLATFPLAKPSGTVSSGVLTFNAGAAASVSATGFATVAAVQDSAGNNVISGLSVSIPLSGANVILANGQNTTLISTSFTSISLSAAQIIGS